MSNLILIKIFKWDMSNVNDNNNWRAWCRGDGFNYYISCKREINRLNADYAMKQNQNYKYVLLYQQSPEFQKLVKKSKVNVEIW